MSEKTPAYSDEELGAALRALETPEHGPRFDLDLRRRLADEGSGASVVPLGVRGRNRRLFVGIAVAAAAALAIALPLADRLGGADVASAAEVQAHVRASLSSLESLGGVLVSSCSGCTAEREEVRWRFLLTSEGDVRIVGPTLVTYSASDGVVRGALRSESAGGATLFYSERRGEAPGPPDGGSPAWILYRQYGTFVRALLGAEDPRVREVVYQGRAAWRLDVDGLVDFIADRLEITIDRETGIPVQVVESRGGEVLSEHRVEQLAVDADYGPGAFRLAIPADAEVSRSDGGFRRVTLDEVRALTGYQPIVPTWVPDGYDLAEVAVAEGSDGAQAGNPRSRMVVSLSYRRAFDQFVVTTRLAGDGNWSDPLATGEGRHGSLDHPEKLPIRQGAFGGVSAELVITLRGIPHVWAHGDDLVLTVAGALSRDELVRVTESLERR